MRTSDFESGMRGTMNAGSFKAARYPYDRLIKRSSFLAHNILLNYLFASAPLRRCAANPMTVKFLSNKDRFQGPIL